MMTKELKECMVVITDEFFLGAGVRAVVVVRQILDWQQPHRHVLVKRRQVLSVNFHLHQQDRCHARVFEEFLGAVSD